MTVTFVFMDNTFCTLIGLLYHTNRFCRMSYNNISVISVLLVIGFRIDSFFVNNPHFLWIDDICLNPIDRDVSHLSL